MGIWIVFRLGLLWIMSPSILFYILFVHMHISRGFKTLGFSQISWIIQCVVCSSFVDTASFPEWLCKFTPRVWVLAPPPCQDLLSSLPFFFFLYSRHSSRHVGISHCGLNLQSPDEYGCWATFCVCIPVVYVWIGHLSIFYETSISAPLLILCNLLFCLCLFHTSSLNSSTPSWLEVNAP